MSIGVGLALIAIGAVLAFAATFDIAGLNINIVGGILMAVGATSLILTFTYWRPRRRAMAARRSPHPGDPELDGPEVGGPELRDDPRGPIPPDRP